MDLGNAREENRMANRVSSLFSEKERRRGNTKCKFGKARGVKLLLTDDKRGALSSRGYRVIIQWAVLVRARRSASSSFRNVWPRYAILRKDVFDVGVDLKAKWPVS